MAQYKSFKDLVSELCYNLIFDEVEDFVENNPDTLECGTYIVQIPDEAILSDLKIMGISITDSVDTEIIFDVIVSAEIEVIETVRGNREIDCAEQWFKVCCRADIEDGLHNIIIRNVQVYNKSRNRTTKKLSNELVPIIAKEQLDIVAEEFLQEFYPDALEEPMPVPAMEIANRMGLKVIEVYLTKYCSVFGEIFFDDCIADYYDKSEEKYNTLNVEKGTILIDPNVYFMRNVGSMNNTIIHECVHWYKHKKYHELEKLFSNEAKMISCRVEETTRKKEDWTPEDWMEWQANGIAPRILMPASTMRIKVEELVEKYKRLLQTDKITDVIESVIDELSEFYSVSRLAAKIRMIDLGYTEAIGVYSYADNRYIPNYEFNRDSIKKFQTFTIGIQDACFLYTTNPKFKGLLDTGKYLYIDAHFCINDSKYVITDEGGNVKLTEYANSHIDECCLVFDVSINGSKKFGTINYMNNIMYRDVVNKTVVETDFSYSEKNKSTDARAEELRLCSNEVSKITRILKGLPSTFSESLVSHMKREKCSVEKLSENSLVGTKTIQRLRNNDDYVTTLDSVVAICIGLHLHPILSMDLVEKAGFTFKKSDSHVTYMVLLVSHYKNSIYECNEVLESMGLPALGKEE